MFARPGLLGTPGLVFPAQILCIRVDVQKIHFELEQRAGANSAVHDDVRDGWLESFGRLCPSKKISAPPESSKRGPLNLESIAPSDRDEAVW
jgi:hypothetical protein